jgi:fructose 1,6-bisphosphate aldolase/phosphatase
VHTTVIVIKADVGSLAGHVKVPEELLKLLGPVDLFDDIAFDYSRRKAMAIGDYMRRHGPFEPHLLHPEELEYTTLPQVIERLKKHFEPVE